MAKDNAQSFGRLVLARAWLGAWRFFNSRLRDAVVFVCLFTVGGIFYYHFYGFPATKDQVMPVLIFTVGPIVGLWLILFLWHLWLAPVALLYECRGSTDTSEEAGAPLTRTASREKSINWAPWKHRSEYSVFEFAKILAETDPGAQSMTTEGSSFARLLTEEMKGGNLSYIPRYGERFDGLRNHKFELEIDNDTRLKREDALPWAKAKRFPVSHIE